MNSSGATKFIEPEEMVLKFENYRLEYKYSAVCIEVFAVMYLFFFLKGLLSVIFFKQSPKT